MALRNDDSRNVPVELPASLRERAEEMASRECLSLSLFVATAVAETLQRKQLELCLETAETRPIQLPSDDGKTLIH